MKNIILFLLIIPSLLSAQDRLKGVVFEGNSIEKRAPLIGANVYWLNTSIGDVTDETGSFELPYKKEFTQLVISYVGFKTDTIHIKRLKKIEHWLQPVNALNEVVLQQRRKSTSVSYYKAINVVNMSSEELLKAACCNLCESFETNPSIDVNFADAITGTRQIKMLGLTSPYILTAIESVPSIRGASQIFGLSFIPGTWVESIQITKGAGTVINGYESIAGQINSKLQKPVNDSKLFVNAYGADNGRYELNTHFNTKLNDKLFTGFYIHGNKRDTKHDKNEDSFLDMPLAEQFNIMNRWQYTDLAKGIVSFFDVRYLNDEKQLGQSEYDLKTDKFTNNYWGSEIHTERFDVSGKYSYLNPQISHQSLDLLVTFSNHEQDAYYGHNVYDIRQNSLFARAVYGSIINNTKNKIKTGVNLMIDYFNEKVGHYENTMNYKRKEHAIGAFLEYNYDNIDDFNLTAGLRIDNHNLLGTFLTPRIHSRYTPWENAAFRASIGRGKRSANIFAENQYIFATSRNVIIENSGGEIYGLDPEIAWNYGISYLQGFNLFGKKADIVFDFYRTDFSNQIVVDLENPDEVRFYNLEGESYSNSFQTEFSYTPAESLNIKLAYKFYDVKTQFKSEKREKPLSPKHRFFANAAYETSPSENGGKWKFDATFNWVGEQRFPSTDVNPIQFQVGEYAPSVGTLNAQITKVFSSRFEIYAGGENMTNIKQKNPILGAEDPFGSYFDTTFVYGPIFGSTYYTGLRYKLN